MPSYTRKLPDESEQQYATRLSEGKALLNAGPKTPGPLLSPLQKIELERAVRTFIAIYGLTPTQASAMSGEEFEGHTYKLREQRGNERKKRASYRGATPPTRFGTPNVM